MFAPSPTDLVFSSLEEIEERSQVLLKKKKTAGFLDKAKDSQEVVSLVEKLKTAIVYYRVSRDYAAQAETGSDTHGTALTATIHVQSDRQIDGKVPHRSFIRPRS